MFKNIKKLLGNDYKKIKRAMNILTVDAIFHGTIYCMLFLVLINIVNNELTKKNIFIYTAILFIMFIIRYFILFKGYYSIQADGARSIANLRIYMGDYIRNLNMGFFNKNNIGEITNIVTNDLNDFENYITHQTSELIKLSILIVYLSIIIIVYEPFLGLIQVLLFLFCIPVAILCSRAIKKQGYLMKKVRASMLSRVIEYVRGVEVFKSYNMVGEKFKKLEESLSGVRKQSIKLELTGIPYLVPLQAIIGLSFPIVLYFAVVRYIDNIINTEQLVTFMIISLAYTNILISFSGMFVQSRYFSLSVDKLLSVLEIPEIDYQFKEYDFDNFDIEFKNVEFSYIGNEKVIKNVDFIAKEGSMTALVGSSGSGKSTIMNLIARFWDVDSGVIEIGGTDIRKVYPDNLLKNISMVFQDVYLIEGSIYDNIRIGNQNASEQEVVEAARKAYCHEFIDKLPMGYDTLVHEEGSSLSGGEKQRISIARAFLKDAPIILLDEATASLDVDNEYMIQQSFRELIKGRTVIIIAHRLNTIKDADNILVFEEGNIIERGSHQELMNMNGKYANMYKKMSEAKEWQI
ncbi:MAG: ABC transporter ATP-binding protein [Andreesenia angusta]|nr:ABC transporter ATP-binding protein [Andreesenia angusta]